jgi:hypothetical protein
MSSFSDSLEAALLNHVFGATAFAQPAGRFVALYTAPPSDTGGGTEVSASGTGYARTAVTFGAATGSGAGPSTVRNSANVEFPAATTNWGDVTHFAIFTASTAGTMLGWAPLAAARTILAGDTLRFLANELAVTLD